MKFHLDFNGTDGTDPTKVSRVYTNGQRVPLSDPEPTFPDEVAALAARSIGELDIDNLTLSVATLKIILRAFHRRIRWLERRLNELDS